MEVKDSARLRFSLMTRDDAQLLYQLDNDPAVMRYINGGNVSTMEYITEVYIPRLESFTNKKQGWGLWKVTIKDTNDFIGWVLVRPMEFFSDAPEFDNLELGWRFMQKSWGKGYATEAALAVKDALIKQGAVKQFSAIALKENNDSFNIMTKLGMTYVKAGIHHDPLGDMEVLYYQLTLG